MRQIFDVRRQLKQHDNALLQQLFAERRVLLDLSWATLKQADVDPIMAHIMALPSGKRRELQALLQAIAKLSDSRGLKVIHEELKWRYPEKVESWTDQKNRADKALWVYLNARDAFEEATVFARADALSTTRYFNRWSPVVTNGFEVSCERIGALKKGLTEHYSQREARGEDCAVHHYTRLNGNEYFFAYLRDWPNNFMVFNDDGELESLDLPTAFTDLFVFERDTGALEMIASGGATVQQRLRRVFYQALCGLEVGDASPERPEFLLDHLLLPDFAFRLEDRDRIESVTVPRILLFPKTEHEELEALQPRFRKGVEWDAATLIIDDLLESQGLTRSQVTVVHIHIRLNFMSDGLRNGTSLTIKMSPRASDLKRIDDEELQAIADRCFRRWGIIDV